MLAEQGGELAAGAGQAREDEGPERHLERIHELEHQADGISRAAIGRLFRDGHDPLDVIKWREIYLELENAIDAGRGRRRGNRANDPQARLMRAPLGGREVG